MVQAISAASILAKVHRDALCADLHRLHPAYGFDQHKGYPTAAHLQALQHGGLHIEGPLHPIHLPSVVAIKYSTDRPDYIRLTELAGHKIHVSNPSEEEWLDNIIELNWKLSIFMKLFNKKIDKVRITICLSFISIFYSS